LVRPLLVQNQTLLFKILGLKSGFLQNSCAKLQRESHGERRLE